MSARQRYQNALDAQGATDPTAVARALHHACAECLSEQASTAEVCDDPAVRLLVFALAYLCWGTTGFEPERYADYFAACERLRRVKN